MSAEQEDLKTINRREANSGKISYSDPVIIHESSKSRVSVVPFFIPHTDHTELAIKIQTYKKMKPPIDWMLIDEKSVSLKENASRKLLEVLHSHLKVAKEDSDGQYLIIRINDGTAQLSEHDPAAVASALTKVLAKEEILNHLVNADLTDELTNAFHGAIRLKEMQTAVTELRLHLEKGEYNEQIYQKWCEKHPWSFGNAYVVRDDIRNISIKDHLDIMLSNVIAGFRDIVELKRPDMDVIKFDSSHNNYYFSGEVSKAIGQCHRYIDVFSEEAHKGLRDNPEIIAYYPKAIIVIGRSNDWKEDQHRALHGLNNRLNNITVMTYDHLLNQGERLVEMLSAKKEEDIDEEENDEDYEINF
ncbi:Shedu anti-phage system protein SduA domain-containing protein [Leptospira sp. WS4.C2]